MEQVLQIFQLKTVKFLKLLRNLIYQNMLYAYEE